VRLVLMGPPGSGKKIQGAMLSEKIGVPYVVVEEMLAVAAEEGSKLGEKAQYYIERGQPVPDELLVDLVEHRLLKPDCKEGFVLDGFPKSVSQCNRFMSIMKMRRWPLRSAINLMVSQETVVKRLSGRRICDQCGKEYNEFFDPPEKDGVCDACGGQLFQAKEDRKESVVKRLNEYSSAIRPLEAHLRQKGMLIEVNGDASKEEVFQDICEALRI